MCSTVLSRTALRSCVRLRGSDLPACGASAMSSKSMFDARSPRFWGYPSLSTVEDLLEDFKKRLAVPWRNDEPPAGRVWILWYDKVHERPVRRRPREF